MSIAALGIFIAPQLRYNEETITPSGIASSEITNKRVVVEKGDTSVFAPATAIDSLQRDKKQLAPEPTLSQIIAQASPLPATEPATEQLEPEQLRVPKTPEAVDQKKKTENVLLRLPLANNSQAPEHSPAQPVDELNQKPSLDNEVIAAVPKMQKSSPEPSANRLPLTGREPAKTSEANENIRVAAIPSTTKKRTLDAPIIVSALPSLILEKLDAAQPVPTARPAGYVQHPVIGNPLESIATSIATMEADLPAAELKTLLSRLTLAYETGNLRQLVSVFADNARSNGKTSLNEIEDDYRKLFNVTDMRKMMISGIQWSKLNNKMRGKGNFQILVREKGAGRVTAYDGSIKFDVAQSARGIVVTQLDYRYDE